MSRLGMRVGSAIGTAVVFVIALWTNEHLFSHSQFARGVNWIYLPAGVRLLATLLLGADGALGLLLASWLVDCCYFFPHDLLRAFTGGILSTAAPYAVYRLARERYGLEASLRNLTAKRLLALALAYAFANALLHYLWFALRGGMHHLTLRFVAILVGDLSGTLLVLYALKIALALLGLLGLTARRTRGAPD
ncbi:hypothetical protein [Paraburkholderia jirisanensis]